MEAYLVAPARILNPLIYIYSGIYYFINSTLFISSAIIRKQARADFATHAGIDRMYQWERKVASASGSLCGGSCLIEAIQDVLLPQNVLLSILRV